MTLSQAHTLTPRQRIRLIRKIGQRVTDPWALYWGDWRRAATHNPHLTAVYRVLMEAEGTTRPSAWID